MFLKCLGFYRSKSKHTSSPQRNYPTIIEELCHQFSLNDLRKSTNNFDYRQTIGIGSRIYKGCLEHNGVIDYAVAVKWIHGKSHKEIPEFKNEIELLCQLRHPNLISLIGFCDQENDKFLVYEYMSNKSLDQQLQVGELSWKKRLEICIGAARGLHYLHAGAKRTIIHRDIKPSNILLDDHMEPKLADFSISLQGPRFMSKPKPIKVDFVSGTFGYLAMEYIRDLTVTDKTDVYSFGMVLLEVVWGERYTKAGAKYLKDPVEEKIDPNIKGKIAPECWQVFIDITQRCVACEADERPAMGEVEVQLEYALFLQEQADITNANDDYTLFSTTIIDMGVELESCTEDTDNEDA